MLNMEQILSGEIQRMSHIERYSSYPMSRRENVAEHSWYVTFYAFCIHADLGRRGYDVDIGDVLWRSLVHDVDECVMGDVVITTKHQVPGLKEALDSAAFERVGIVSNDIFGCDYLSDLWRESKADGLPGAITQLCDYLSVVSYIFQEHNFGNKVATRIASEISERLNDWLGSLEELVVEALEPYVRQTLVFLMKV
jgi:5'-deoxynucleotidase YfbR-like HD superfamily hydrolase